MKWTDHDKYMKRRVLQNLTEEERLWWKGILERVAKDAMFEQWQLSQEYFNKWFQENQGRYISYQPTQEVIVRRQRDDRNIFEKGFDFILGED